jgi:hypothetical protein
MKSIYTREVCNRRWWNIYVQQEALSILALVMFDLYEVRSGELFYKLSEALLPAE